MLLDDIDFNRISAQTNQRLHSGQISFYTITKHLETKIIS